MRKQLLITILVSLLLLSLTQCASPAEEQINSSEKAFKGMEMYSWQDESEVWWFSILIGTNRIKTVEEVMSAPLDITGVKQRLCQLGIGEQVLWSNREIGVPLDGTSSFLIPPQGMIDELTDRALECRVELIASFE